MLGLLLVTLASAAFGVNGIQMVKSLVKYLSQI